MQEEQNNIQELLYMCDNLPLFLKKKILIAWDFADEKLKLRIVEILNDFFQKKAEQKQKHSEAWVRLIEDTMEKADKIARENFKDFENKESQSDAKVAEEILKKISE